MQHYIVGCDIGTTNVKAIAFALNGRVVASKSASYPMVHPAPGYAEQDPETVFLSVCQVLQELLDKIPGVPLAIVFSSAMHSLMALDKRGRPTSPLLIWADNRSGNEADELRHSEAGKRQYQRTGTPVHAMTPACKLLWVNRHRPKGLYNAWKYVGIKDYVLYRLTGRFACDYSMAAATGLLNITELCWDQATLDSLGITTAQLPEIVSPYQQLQATESNEWHFLSGVPIIVGGSDGCLANIGSGAGANGTLALTIGTSGAIRKTVATPYLDPLMRTFCYPLDRELFIVGGPTNNGGVIFQWLKDTFFQDLSFDEITEGAAAIPPGSEGLLCFPYLLGERAPLWRSDIRGCFHGMEIGHTRFHFARSVMEGILLNLFTIGEVLLQNEPVHTLYANGGFAQNRVFVQVLADIFGINVALNTTNDAGCIGAALIGLRSLNLISDLTNPGDFVKTAEVITFDPLRHELYQPVIANFQKLLYAVPL